MKVVFLAVGTSTPPSVMRWAYNSAHNLRKHGHEAMVFPWFAVLQEHHIEKFANTYLEPGDVLAFSTEFAFH